MNRSTNRTVRLDLMEAIVDEYQAPLLRYAARMLGDSFTAQDVVQNVFIKLFRHMPKHSRPGPGLRCWLYRVTHNEVLDHIRRRTRRGDLHRKQAQEAASSPPQARAAGRDVQAAVLAHVHRLKEPDRYMVLLRLQEGLSYKEISGVTGRTVGNVGCILHHAMKRLADGLVREGVVSGRGGGRGGERNGSKKSRAPGIEGGSSHRSFGIGIDRKSGRDS